MRVNSNRSLVLSLLFSSVSTIGAVNAQGPAVAYPINNWSYINHSSTAAEGALRGQAAVIGAMGQTEYMDSLASINYQEAYKRAIENSVAATKAYYERRELHAEFMKKYGPKPFVGEARKKALEYYQPKRLTTREFNAQTGTLVWPHILRQEQFEPIKTQIDEAFSKRTAENSGDGSPTHRQIYRLCSALSGLLRENISKVTMDQYIDASEFIRSVELEGRNELAAPMDPIPAAGNAEQEVAAPPAKVEGDAASKIVSKKTLKT